MDSNESPIKGETENTEPTAATEKQAVPAQQPQQGLQVTLGLPELQLLQGDNLKLALDLRQGVQLLPGLKVKPGEPVLQVRLEVKGIRVTLGLQEQKTTLGIQVEQARNVQTEEESQSDQTE
jgi:hypothetical protein